MHGSSHSGTAEWEAFHLHQKETKNPLAKDQNQNPGLPRHWLLVYPIEHKIDCPKNVSKLTPIGNIEFDSKISIGPSRVVAGCQDDATNGFDLSNDAGYSRGGEDSILSNNQAANLEEEIQNTHFHINTSRATTQKHHTTGRWTKNYPIGPGKMFFNEFLQLGWLLLFRSRILLLLLNNIITEIESLLLNKAIPSDSLLVLCSFRIVYELGVL